MADSEAQTATRSLLLIGLVYLFYYLVVGPFQLVIKPRCDALGLGDDAGKWMIGFLYAALGLARILSGPLVARIGGRAGLMLASGLMLVSVAITWNATLMWVLLAGMAVLGAASALLWSAGGALSLAAAAADQRGKLAGRLYVFTGIGLILGSLSVDFFLRGEDGFSLSGFPALQGFWLVAAALAVVCSWAIGLRGDRASRIEHPWQVVRTLVARGGGLVFLLLAGAALSYGAFYSLVTGVIAGLPAVASHLGAVSLPLYGIMAFSSLVVGPASDRFGRRIVLVTGAAIGAAGFVLLAIVAGLDEPSPAVCWGLVGSGCFGLGWCFSAVQTAALAWIGDTIEAGDRATAIGITFIGRDLGIAVASMIALWVVAAGDRLEPWGWSGPKLALAAFAVLLALLAPLGAALKRPSNP